MGVAGKLTTVPFVVVQEKKDEFKGDYYDSLVIGAKTFFT